MDIRIPAATLAKPNNDVPPQVKKRQNAAPSESFAQVLASASGNDPKVANAAKQFEAMIVGQVLKAAREASDGGWLGNDDDQTGELALEMAEQGFAQAVAARGGLGISKSVVANLHHDVVKAASSEQPTSN